MGHDRAQEIGQWDQEGFRGWLVATVALYGPDDRLATKPPLQRHPVVMAFNTSQRRAPATVLASQVEAYRTFRRLRTVRAAVDTDVSAAGGGGGGFKCSCGSADTAIRLGRGPVAAQERQLLAKPTQLSAHVINRIVYTLHLAAPEQAINPVEP